jgi:hypothetical protein
VTGADQLLANETFQPRCEPALLVISHESFSTLQQRVLHQSHNYKYIRSKFVLEVHTMMDDRPENSDEGRRTLTSGDIIATQVQRTDDGSLAADATDWNQIAHFNFREKVPHLSEGEQILIRILSAGKYLAYAEPVDISGYMMRVTLEPGSRFATPVDTDYRVHVRLDEPPVVGGFADIKVTGVSDMINGHIHSYNNDPPEVGDRFRTHLDHGSDMQRVRSSDGHFRVSMDGYVLISGEAEVELTGRGSPMKAKVLSYHSEFPAVGDTITSQVRAGQRTVESPTETFQIELTESASGPGEVRIRITDVSDAIYGKIREYKSKDQDVSSYRSPRKTSMVDNSYITGRKL